MQKINKPDFARYINTQQDTSKQQINQQIKNNLSKQLINQLNQLPVKVSDQWVFCVAGHINKLGYDKVCEIAERAKVARKPENYFMKSLSRESYASI